jgi:hypothetical protein
VEKANIFILQSNVAMQHASGMGWCSSLEGSVQGGGNEEHWVLVEDPVEGEIKDAGKGSRLNSEVAENGRKERTQNSSERTGHHQQDYVDFLYQKGKKKEKIYDKPICRLLGKGHIWLCDVGTGK